MKQLMKDIKQETSKSREVMEKNEKESSESFKQLEEEMGNRAWEMSDHKRDFTLVKECCDGLGIMFNPTKDQVEKMKSAIQELKDTGNRSDFESISSGSPEREDRRQSQNDGQRISLEALKDLQQKIDRLKEELRQEFSHQLEVSDENQWKSIQRTSEKWTSYRTHSEENWKH